MTSLATFLTSPAVSRAFCHFRSKVYVSLLFLDEFTGNLKGDLLSAVKITIQPQRPEEMPRTKWAATSIGDLMTSISLLTLPEGWERMETADGRTYFKNMADGKTTVAYNLSVPVETALLIPTASSLEQPQQPDKVSSPFRTRFRKKKILRPPFCLRARDYIQRESISSSDHWVTLYSCGGSKYYLEIIPCSPVGASWSRLCDHCRGRSFVAPQATAHIRLTAGCTAVLQAWWKMC